MGDKSAIEWTDASWNPVAGCSRVSPGCDNCYAIPQAHRMASNPNPGIQSVYFGTTVEGGKDWSGQVNTIPSRLDQPLRWKRPRRIFVNSMSDLFHESVPAAFIAEVFAVMADADHHVFQVLTKRHARMTSMLNNPAFEMQVLKLASAGKARWPLPNVWLGVSVESGRYGFRLPALADTPAAVRWASVEPLVAPPGDLDLRGIDWVVCGGESGHNARPMHPDWARSVRDQALMAGSRFFFKQWGEWSPGYHNADCIVLKADGDSFSVTDQTPTVWDGRRAMYRVGKKNSGRLLDDRTWDEYPDDQGDDS